MRENPPTTVVLKMKEGPGARNVVILLEAENKPQFIASKKMGT